MNRGPMVAKMKFTGQFPEANTKCYGNTAFPARVHFVYLEKKYRIKMNVEDFHRTDTEHHERSWNTQLRRQISAL
jgi:hypothetical protein